MSGVAAALCSGFAGLVSALSAGSAVGDGLTTGGPAQGQITFNADGTITYFTTSSGAKSGPTNWYNPTVASIGANYRVRFVVTAGTATSNGASTVSAFPASISKDVASGSGAANCTFTVEIYDSTGTTLLVSSPGWTVGYVHTV